MRLLDDTHAVMRPDGKLACKGRHARAVEFLWSNNLVDWQLLTFPTRHGAQLFANMNGGAPVPLSSLQAVA